MVPATVADGPLRRGQLNVAREKKKLLNRLRRLKGQVEAMERAVEADRACVEVLQQANACRGALDGFVGELIEDHIREHVLDPDAPQSDPRSRAGEELIRIVHVYVA